MISRIHPSYIRTLGFVSAGVLKKRLGKIVHKIRNSSVGRAGYSMADFVGDVKCSCAREGVPFDNDVFNELAG
jgi:hypothetical protein